MVKMWYESKTLWINVIAIVVAILIEFIALPIVGEQLHMWLTFAIAVLNIILRFITEFPIENPLRR